MALKAHMGSVGITPKSAVPRLHTTTPTHGNIKKANVFSLLEDGGVSSATSLNTIASVAVSQLSAKGERRGPTNFSFLPPSNSDRQSPPSTSRSASTRPKRPVPGPLNHARDNRRAAPPPVLDSAQIITDLNTITYPRTVKAPSPDLNVGATPGKFRYDREFLLQFRDVCKEPPDSLPSLARRAQGISVVGAWIDVVLTLWLWALPPLQPKASIGLGPGSDLENRSGLAMGEFQSSSSAQSRFEINNGTRVGGMPFGSGAAIHLAYPTHNANQGSNYPAKPNDWNVAGGAGVSRPPARAGDLSQFGKISKPTGIHFGRSSVFSKHMGGTNMFSVLSSGAADGPPPPIERTTSSRKPSVDLGPGRSSATAGTGGMRKLVLQPRIKPSEVEDSEPEGEEVASVAMTEEEAQNKAKEDVKEYLAVENIDEAIMALEALPSGHRYLFVDKLVNTSMDGGNKVVVLAEKLFFAARTRSVIFPEGFERGLLPTIEMADDLSIDVPKTYEWLARMIHAAGLDEARTEEMADKISVYGGPPVPPRELLMKEFERLSYTPSPSLGVTAQPFAPDQLKSHKELETVTQQFSLLVTQTQEQSIGDLYVHIGGLILERTARIQLEGFKDDIRLCAELCYYLLAIHFEQRSGLPRVVFIHEHLFRLCIDSISAENIVQSTKARDSNESTPGTTSPSNNNAISVEKNSELIFHLFNFQLISLAQISEYTFRVILSHGTSIGTRLGDAVAGVRLLAGLFPGSHGPWKREVDSLNKWIDTHSILDENKAHTSSDRAIQSQEPHGITAKDKPTQDKSPSSPLSNDSGGPPLNSLGGPDTFDETVYSLESQAHEGEKVDDAVGNNIGKPPRTPSTSRAESPVEGWPEERQLSTDVATFAGRQMTSSDDASSSATEDLPKDMEGSTSCSSIITPNVTMSPLPLMTFPFLGPTSRFSPPPVQLHPPPTPPEFSIASSHLSPDIPVTPLQNSRSSSPSSSNNVPNFSPSDPRRSTNHVQTSGASGAVSTPEDQVLLSPKLASTKTEDQVNDRLTKEQEEQNKASREKEERERKERETVEENKRAREEAERKADEARRREELQTAERKLIEETKRTAEQECGARKRAERKTERKAEKRRDREEAARKAEEEADHKAKVDKMREDIERMARREAGLKAKKEAELKTKREEERKEQERKKMERKALEEGERKAQVDKMRQEMVRMAKKEAELKAKREEERKEQERKEMERVTLEEEERKAQVDKMRQEIERMARKEAELKARKEAEYKAKVDKMRENMERMAKREAEIRARREEERQAREEEERKAREEVERKELERRAKEEEEEQRQAEQKAKRIAERQTKKEAKRKARETLWTGTAPYAEAPPQWDPTEYYDPPHEYNPYMDWGDHSQDQYSTMPQAHHTATEFSPRPLATQPRPPSPSLSNFPPLPSTSAWSSMSPSSSKTTWSSVATQKRGKMLQIRSGTEQQRNEWWAGE